MELSDFSYHLPPQLIAHAPATPRDASRLLVLDRRTEKISDQTFSDLPSLLSPGDVLILNQTKVLPARLFARKPTGGQVEILLISPLSPNRWTALTKPGLKPDTLVHFSPRLSARVIASPSSSPAVLEFNLSAPALTRSINRLGLTPLPPYIHSPLSESELKSRYQSVYARHTGSAAAPTAGLHFTPKLLDRLKSRGISLEFVTLHVGLGTFKPVTPAQLASGTLHPEHFSIPVSVARRLNRYKQQGRRLIAVGTTTVRTLESAASSSGLLTRLSGQTDIFIRPPYSFRFVDALITNFHLPESSLLMLISAFTSAPNTPHPFTSFLDTPVGAAYTHAVDHRYRFFSFGDAMFIR